MKNAPLNDALTIPAELQLYKSLVLALLHRAHSSHRLHQDVSVAVARIPIPARESAWLQALAVYARVNSTFIGHKLLTAPNAEHGDDEFLLELTRGKLRNTAAIQGSASLSSIQEQATHAR